MDFARQQKAPEAVSATTSTKLKEAASLVKALPTVEEELLQKRAAAEAVKAEEKKSLESRQGCAGCLGFLAFCALLGGVISQQLRRDIRARAGGRCEYCRVLEALLLPEAP